MKSEKKKIIFALSLVTQIGISAMVPIFLCMFIAIKLSERLGRDYIVLLGIGFGIAVSFRNIYVLTRRMYYKDYQREKKEQDYFRSLREAEPEEDDLDDIDDINDRRETSAGGDDPGEAGSR